jgi:hypothetical protein
MPNKVLECVINIIVNWPHLERTKYYCNLLVFVTLTNPFSVLYHLSILVFEVVLFRTFIKMLIYMYASMTLFNFTAQWRNKFRKPQLSAQLAKWLGKEPSRGPNESSSELEGVEGTLPIPGIPSSRFCLTTKGKIYMHSISRKSIIEELVMDDEDILRRAITRMRKMNKKEDKEEVGNEEEEGREMGF